MLTARNRGAGMSICFPDVCLTPPLATPVPYVNLAMDATAVPFAVKTYFSCVNALNMGSIVPLTLGDQSGAMSPFMGPGQVTMGNPKVFIEALPGTNLLCPATGNNMVAALGAVLSPSITNVFLTYASGDGEKGGGATEVDADAIAELSRALAADRDIEAASLPGGIAYARVTAFSLGLPAQIHTLIERLAPRALLVDLRGCPGGELASAIDLASDFLPEGAEIATVADAEGDDTVYRSRSACAITAPLVVLVDRNTASAAEVFAGALQAQGRATIVGERTFGKGVAQQVVSARAGRGAHKAAVGTVTLPGGKPLQGFGVTPDVAWESPSR